MLGELAWASEWTPSDTAGLAWLFSALWLLSASVTPTPKLLVTRVSSLTWHFPRVFCGADDFDHPVYCTPDLLVVRRDT